MGVLVPVGRAQARERRHHIAAVGVLDLAGHILGVPGFFQQLELVPQPLDGGTGHENGALQRVMYFAVQAPGNGGDQAVLGEHRLLARVHQHEAAGAERIFCLAGGKAGLAEERRLLVACRARDFDAVAKVHGVSPLIKAAGGHGVRQHTFGDIKLFQNLIVPLQGVDVEHHGAAGVGIIRDMDLATGQLPNEPGLHGAKQQLARLGLFPRAGHVVQNPFQLGGGEIGVNDKAGLLAEFLRQAFGLELVAVGAGAAALPDDGVVNGLAGVTVPHDGGLALVGDADGRNVRRAGSHLVHSRKCHAQLGGPDLIGVVLHPARFGEILGKLLLCHTAHLAFFIEQDAAVGSGSGIQCHDV